MKHIHLICNAHIDPVWLWEWEEGAGVALSTFRTAARLCEEFDGFVFNHNEALLYRWIEEYDADLFTQIQDLVRRGRWKIIGGWYLQPDCNMPSGESFVRQILVGRHYFRQKFGVEPLTAVNFDSFGHSLGLVQILQQAGYKYYAHCNPTQQEVALPAEDYRWCGLAGSELVCHRFPMGYGSFAGKADEKVANWMKSHPDKAPGMVPWGLGDHGGGPTRTDLERLAALQESTREREIVHSTLDAYFEELDKSELPRYEKSINPRYVGTYSSQSYIKQRHRKLESAYFLAEKMVSQAAWNGLIAYPKEELDEALRALLLGEFHDILPGTSIQAAEQASLRLMDHGLEIVSRLKARAFFALARGQAAAEPGVITLLVYNPHPYPLDVPIDCEFNLDSPSLELEYAYPEISRDGAPVPCQGEKEASSIPIEFRKRVVFHASLGPGDMARYDCRTKILPRKPEPQLRGGCNSGLSMTNTHFEHVTSYASVAVNRATGLVDRFAVDGFDFLLPGAFQALVMEDINCAWGTGKKRYTKISGAFELLSPNETTAFCGVQERMLEPVHVIEDGPVRSVIEAVYKYNHSFIVQQYRFYKHSAELEIELRVYWNEHKSLLKLAVPTVLREAEYWGEIAYGREQLESTGVERVAQKWVGAFCKKTEKAFTAINDSTYGSSFRGGELRLTLLRSPVYSAHRFFERTYMPQDRYGVRIDQGEHVYRFWFSGGDLQARWDAVSREAQWHNEPPMALSYYPPGEARPVMPIAVLHDDVILLSAVKRSEDADSFVLRLFEPTGVDRLADIEVPALGIREQIPLCGYEIKTLRINAAEQTVAQGKLLD